MRIIGASISLTTNSGHGLDSGQLLIEFFICVKFIKSQLGKVQFSNPNSLTTSAYTKSVVGLSSGFLIKAWVEKH